MADEKFYFNPSTGEVTQGKVASWDNRMGPYDTREEAERALETAAQRNQVADDQDEAWED
ncbi:hypothetical protein CKJ81_01655 [Corynebacterium hadale]|uniref:SPOR domain-containing protein n=3 Tax=Corynebacterium TaxID=1716 RepID=A0A269PCA2_9CORY|nr:MULTISPECIES: hypothetical protein [Corynebacterium]MBL7286351.1 hypothetical protein [Corynebacterium godavarianum]MCG7254596.1 hypothetical protein [Corynebacterium hadale]MCG7256153.1 hypothetical protein [Corynebacterium hadale]MCG7265990.1 hypothetical protein [Corynebacterium hadale]PAJ69186.1 hypothetical protein CIG21_08810 [Corynebacterium hadale]